ncbi:hypothetical protein, partial [Klebsiella pneumoniae]|uniref:hypothetical protein n=1 Tax=Klebsiella pneumoniae TaxID=573 RepID=UPI003EBAB78E
MKSLYDRKAKVRELKIGDEVLALLPVQGRPLAARYSGPYRVAKRIGDIDYVISTPDRRKATQLCHINMLKPYHRPGGSSDSLLKKEAVIGIVSRLSLGEEMTAEACGTRESQELLQSV